jgi:hypothetical protein
VPVRELFAVAGQSSELRSARGALRHAAGTSPATSSECADFRNEADLKDKAKGTRTERPTKVSAYRAAVLYRLRRPTYDCILFPHIVFKESWFGAVVSNRGHLYNYSVILRERIEGLVALFEELRMLRRRLRVATARRIARGRRTRKRSRGRRVFRRS